MESTKCVCLLFCGFICLSVGCGSQVGGPSESQTNAGTESVEQSVADDKPAEPTVAKIKPESLKFFDLDAKLHQPFVDDATKAIVFVFIATDCPIANYYQPTLARLAEDYVDDNIQFYLIHADADLPKDAAMKHAEEFKIRSPVILDKDLKLAKLVGAEVTPEAHLIDRTGQVRYRGRIDDLYADYGKRRRNPTSHDLRDAIECFVRGEEVKRAKTKAVGCYIAYPKPGNSKEN